jgi:hypothetical protein
MDSHTRAHNTQEERHPPRLSNLLPQIEKHTKNTYNEGRRERHLRKQDIKIGEREREREREREGGRVYCVCV